MAAVWSDGPRRRPVPPRAPLRAAQEPRTAPQKRNVLEGLEELLADEAVRAVPLTTRDRRIIAAALDIAILIGIGNHRDIARHRILQERMLDGDAGYGTPMSRLEAEDSRDLSRAQELAVDRMASEYGRSAVRFQADGSVVVTGMTDDVTRAEVCVERDGRERWRA